jgi:hypothetical protein
MSVEELLATLKAMYEREDRHNRFQAAIQGVDLEEKPDNESVAKDVTSLKGYQAKEAGFGIGLGLGHHVEE